jgi:cell division protein FtsX
MRATLDMLGEVLRILRRSRTSAGLLMLGMGLFWVLLFELLLLTGSSRLLMSGAFRQVPADVYLTAQAGPEDRARLSFLVDSLDQLEWSRLVSPEAAAVEFREAFDQDPVALLGENPFPWSIEVRLPLGGDLERMKAQLEWLGSHPAVEEVHTSGSLLERVALRVRLLATWLTGSLLAILGINALLLKLAWRSILRHWSREMRVMALLGASPSRIRAPLLLTAALQGLLPALAAWGLCLFQLAFLARFGLPLTSPVPLWSLLPLSALLLPLLEWISLAREVRRAYDRA